MSDELVVISGMARGADTHAAEWAKRTPGVTLVPFPADWASHGRRAGPIRNRQMLREGQPDLVVAFSQGSPGTRDMVEVAKAAALPTYTVGKVGPSCS